MELDFKKREYIFGVFAGLELNGASVCLAVCPNTTLILFVEVLSTFSVDLCTSEANMSRNFQINYC